nr:DNA repair protein RecO [Simiduia aestuariiviva]
MHSRAYGDTSLIVDYFSRTHGLQSLYARGAKSKKKTGHRALLNPFIPLTVSAKGRGSLKTLTSIESVGPAYQLKGRALFCGFYLNELIKRLLPEDDGQSQLFDFYSDILSDLAVHAPEWGDAPLEVRLRSFEWLLVQKVGAGFSLVECIDAEPVRPNQYYSLIHQQGLQAVAPGEGAVSGAALLALAEGNLRLESDRQEIKQFMRRVLRPLLGSKPLASRELFK